MNWKGRYLVAQQAASKRGCYFAFEDTPCMSCVQKMLDSVPGRTEGFCPEKKRAFFWSHRAADRYCTIQSWINQWFDILNCEGSRFIYLIFCYLKTGNEKEKEIGNFLSR